MAGFQLEGPAADVSKILYGENRKSYQSPNAQYNFDHFADSIEQGGATAVELPQVKDGNWARTDSMDNILHHDSGTLRNIG
jgi:hypothetical protein